MNFNSLNSIVEAVVGLFKLPAPPAPTVPPPIILLSARRSGLSATRVAKNIISRQVEAGINVGILPSGAVNPSEIMERIRTEEIVNEILENMKITVTIPPGVPVITFGSNGGGPVISQGSTISFALGYAVAQ